MERGAWSQKKGTLGVAGRVARQVLPPVVVLGVVGGVWQWVMVHWGVSAWTFPKPGEVLSAGWDHMGELGSSLWMTAQGALLGFGISAGLGILMGVVLGSSRLLRRAIYPYTVFFQTVPLIAIAPILVIWPGVGQVSVTLCVVVVSVFPVIVNTVAGMESVDPALVDLFRLYGGSWWARLWKLRIPWATPNILSGLRIAAGLAVIGAIIAEDFVGDLNGTEGLGQRIFQAQHNGHPGLFVAAVILSSLLGLGMFTAIGGVSKLLLRRWSNSV